MTVSFATADGTALAPADYLAARGTLTFAPGVTERTLAVTLVDDDLHEESEDLTVTLSDPAHATLAQALAEGRIADDDPMPRVRLAVAAPAGGVVAEGAGATVVTLTGRLEGAARSTPTVMELSVTGVTAGTGDFAAVTPFTLTIPARATVAAAAFTLTPVDDTVAEPPETLTVGSSTAGVVVIPATVTITDDDDVTAPALSGATVEGALLALTYDETLDGASVPAPGAFTVRVARPAPEPPSPADLLDVEGPQTGTGVVTGEPTQAVSDTAAEGRQVSVVAVTVEGRRVTLTLASAVTSGDRVTVSYTPPPAGPATGPIRDGAGNGAGGLSGYPVDSGTPPVVRAVALVSTPTGGAYGVGEKIRAQVTFGEAVVVTGRPRLELDVGGKRRDALHDAGESSGARLVFAYEVASGDSDLDGVGIVADSLATPGGAGIADNENNPAVLRHAGLAAQVSHQVDGVAAELQGAVVRGATLVLTWNEVLDESAKPPAASAFVVAAGGETRPVAGSLVAGSTVTVTLGRAVRHGEVVTVGYTPPAAGPLARRGRHARRGARGGGGRQRDVGGHRREAGHPLLQRRDPGPGCRRRRPSLFRRGGAHRPGDHRHRAGERPSLCRRDRRRRGRRPRRPRPPGRPRRGGEPRRGHRHRAGREDRADLHRDGDPGGPAGGGRVRRGRVLGCRGGRGRP